MKLWCVGIAHGSVARYGTPQDVVWLASGTGFQYRYQKNLGEKKPRRSGVFILYEITSFQS
jgi:hypothetical protein